MSIKFKIVENVDEIRAKCRYNKEWLYYELEFNTRFNIVIGHIYWVIVKS